MKRILLPVLAAAVLIPAAAATANTYDVYACWAGYGTFHNPNASNAAWTKDSTSAGGHFTAHDACGANSINGAITVTSLSGDPASMGESARLKFTAPTSSTVTHVDLWRNAWSYGTGTGSSSQRNDVRVLAGGAAISGGADADGTADVAYGTRGTTNTSQHGIIPANLLTLNPVPLGAGSVEYRVGCGWSAGCPTGSPSGPAPNYFASGVDVYGAKVTVQDTTNPSIVVNDGGLFADETASDVRPILVSTATDASGVKRLEVYADYSSTPVGVVDYEQDVNRCNWTKPAPCQNVSDLEIPVDTRQLTDGDHSFVVKAFDAADNEKASTTHYATVKNAPSNPTPTDPTPPDPTPPGGGSGAGDGAGLPNGTISGTPGSGATAGGPTLRVTFDRNGRSSLNAKYARMVVVRGHLADGSGGAVAGAQIDYNALSTKAGARVQNLGAVRTDSDGTFTLAVATKLGSRRLRFAYRPQLGGPVAVSAEAQLNVIAPVSLAVSPRHVRNKHAVLFRGRLSAGPIPRKGKLVNMQVVVDGHWHTFATVRTAKSGKFKYRYRFKRTYGRVTYRFRARSRYEAAYPFIAGNSRIVRVHVN